ncbi:MAG: formate/nitrite transporter family protein [Candidatus Roizmanbacteria bacterium]
MSIKSPSEILQTTILITKEKVNFSLQKLILLGLLGGAYIAIGGLLALIIGGAIPEIAKTNIGLQKLVFGAVFPLGLFLIVVSGAELFTGNAMIFIPALLSKEIRLKQLMKNWIIVFLANFVGALFVAYFLGYLSDLLASQPWRDTIIGIAERKVHMNWNALFWRAIGCNWLVCLAVWMSYSANSVVDKLISVWFPIMAFVAIGFEHSIANMFYIPLGIFYGADVSWYDFFITNLVPVTLGNILAGSLFVGAMYWYIFKSK